MGIFDILKDKSKDAETMLEEHRNAHKQMYAELFWQTCGNWHAKAKDIKKEVVKQNHISKSENSYKRAVIIERDMDKLELLYRKYKKKRFNANVSKKDFWWLFDISIRYAYYPTKEEIEQDKGWILYDEDWKLDKGSEYIYMPRPSLIPIPPRRNFDD